MNESVDLGLRSLQKPQHGSRDLHRRDIAGAVAIDQFGRRHPAKVIGHAITARAVPSAAAARPLSRI
jgi:hypothetical protein